MVLPCSDRIARVPPYSRPPNHPLPVRGCHPLERAFPDASGSMVKRHWPGPRSLATTNGVSVDFLSSGYLDVSVPRVRLLKLWIQDLIPSRPPCSASPRSNRTVHSQYKRAKVGFPIRKSSDQSSFAAPQGLSQRTTSFIASQRQGIHRMLLRHLIALMINVRHLFQDNRRSERPSSGSRPKTSMLAWQIRRKRLRSPSLARRD